MSELQLAFLSIIGLGIIALAVLYVLEIKSFNKTGNEKYNFLRFFPFELNRYKRDQSSSYVYPILQGFGTLCIATASLFFALQVFYKGGASTIAFILFAISFITALAFNILTFVKLSNYQLHLIFAVILVCLNLLSLICGLFFLPNNNYYFVNTTSQATQITIFIVFFLLLVFEAVLMFNPAYKRWNKMVKVDAETFNRPKFNYLAMLEWGNLLIYILNLIPIALVMFL